jgi:hypothetical protein
VIATLVFEISAKFFRRKLAKIEENCDHNINPWSGESPKTFEWVAPYQVPDAG